MWVPWNTKLATRRTRLFAPASRRRSLERDGRTTTSRLSTKTAMPLGTPSHSARSTASGPARRASGGGGGYATVVSAAAAARPREGRTRGGAAGRAIGRSKRYAQGPNSGTAVSAAAPDSRAPRAPRRRASRRAARAATTAVSSVSITQTCAMRLVASRWAKAPQVAGPAAAARAARAA
jgi:hypothetical protein